MDYTSKEKLEDFEKIEKFRTKVLKYIVYKKRTENEIRKKFENEDQDMLEDTISYFKEQGYIDDNIYVERAINEFMALNTLSIKELKYKLIKKGIDSNIIDDFICKNEEQIVQYEINSCIKIIEKKRKNLDDESIKRYLYSKGYTSDNISIAYERLG